MTVTDEGLWPRDRQYERDVARDAEPSSAQPSDALVDEELPPSRVWIQIAEKLRAEGLMR